MSDRLEELTVMSLHISGKIKGENFCK